MGVQTQRTQEQTIGQLATFVSSLQWMVHDLQSLQGDPYVGQAIKDLAAAEIRLRLAQTQMRAQEQPLAQLQHPPADEKRRSALEDLAGMAQFLTIPGRPLNVYKTAITELAQLKDGETITLQSLAPRLAGLTRKNDLLDPSTLYRLIRPLQDVALITMTPGNRPIDFSQYEVQLTDAARELHEKKWFNTLKPQRKASVAPKF